MERPVEGVKEIPQEPFPEQIEEQIVDSLVSPIMNETEQEIAQQYTADHVPLTQIPESTLVFSSGNGAK